MSEFLKNLNIFNPFENINKFREAKAKGHNFEACLLFIAAFIQSITYFAILISAMYYAVGKLLPYKNPKEIQVSEEVKKLQDEYTRTKAIYRSNPKLLEQKINNIWLRASSIPIEDKSGRKAILGLYTMASDYRWVKGQNQISEINQSLGNSFITYLKSEYFTQGYKEQNEIICLGNSSFEEGKTKTQKKISIQVEECRSYYRAVYLKNLLQSESKFKKIGILALGKSDDSINSNSDFQRTVLIIGIKKVDSLIDVKEALFLHLLNDRTIPFRFWDFSLCKSYNTFYNNDVPCREIDPKTLSEQ